jgi:hypothetical protein
LVAKKKDKSAHSNQTQVSPDPSAPQSKSEAIRGALKELGDIDASATAVKDLIFERWPHLKSQIERDKNWNQIVSQNRKKAAEEFGLRSANSADELPTTVDDLLNVKTLVMQVGGGDPKRLREVLEAIKKLGSVARAIRILNDWESVAELVKPPSA